MIDQKPQPLVSLCMATCLHPDHFQESFQGLLIQTYEPLEIIVLVDGADAESLALLERCTDPRVRYISTPVPSGMIPAWNKICREARGKYLLFCADDDILLPEAIERQVELMEQAENVAFCHADFICIDEKGHEIGRWVSYRGDFIRPGLEAWPFFLVQTRCCMQTTVVRKDLWEQVNRWDEDAGCPGDNSLYLKLLRLGDEGHVSRLACKYRVHKINPYSPQRKFQHLQEHYALSIRHLADLPVGLEVSLKSLRRQLLQHLARIGLPILASTSDDQLKQEIRLWLNTYIWPGSKFGRVCQALDSIHSLTVLTSLGQIEGRLRARMSQMVGTMAGRFKRRSSGPP